MTTLAIPDGRLMVPELDLEFPSLGAGVCERIEDTLTAEDLYQIQSLQFLRLYELILSASYF